MKRISVLLCAVTALSLTACNYNNYDRNTAPFQGSVAFEHPDETVVRPKKMKTMTVKRDLTTTEGGTVHTKTVTETITVPEDMSDADDYKKALDIVDPEDNSVNININKSYQDRPHRNKHRY